MKTNQIKYDTAKGIYSEEYAKENTYFRVLYYGRSNLGKTHGCVTAKFIDRGKPSKLFFIPTDSASNIEGVINTLLTEEEIDNDVIIPRDAETGAMVSLTKYKEVLQAMKEVQKLVKEDTDHHYIVIVDSIDGIEDIFIESYFDSLSRAPNKYDYGRARNLFRREFYYPLMRLKADVFLISGEQDVYATQLNSKVEDDGYMPPTGETVPSFGGTNLKTKNDFLVPLNMVFNLRKIGIGEEDKLQVINVIEKIKVVDDKFNWFKPITLRGFDCNEMPRIFAELRFRQEEARKANTEQRK